MKIELSPRQKYTFPADAGGRVTLNVYDFFTGCKGTDFAIIRTNRYSVGMGPYHVCIADNLADDLDCTDGVCCVEDHAPFITLANIVADWLRKEPSRLELGSSIRELFAELNYCNELAEAAYALRCATGEHEIIDSAIQSAYDSATYKEYQSFFMSAKSSVSPTPARINQEDVKVAAMVAATASKINTTTTKEKEIKDKMSTTNVATTPKGRSNKKELLIASAKRGAKVGLADEAGNVVLQFADSASGGKLSPYMRTAEGKSLVKLVAATLLLHGIDFISDDESTCEHVAAGCGLVVEAAARDFLQPKMAELRKVGLDLARIGALAGTENNE